MRKRITELYFKNYVWWWTRETKSREYNEATHTTRLKPGATNAAWKDEELSAFRYELARRHKRDAGILPYSKAKWAANLLNDIDSFDRQCPFRNENSGIIEKDGCFEAFPNITWNLHAAESLLVAAFLKLIRAARRKRRVRRADGPEGRRNAPVPWRWVELMDIADLIPARPLSKSEKDTLRKARQLAKRCYEYLRAVVQNT